MKVRSALIQAHNTTDKQRNIERHLSYIEEAHRKGAQITCLQELFYAPYFCQVEDRRWYSMAEPIPDGPTTKLLQDVAKQLGMVIIAPMFEEVGISVYYNTAAVIDADGTYLGKYRKKHIPQIHGFLEKFYFKPGDPAYPVFETAFGKIGVYICYDRHFPEGARILGLDGAQIVYIPSATTRGLSYHLWFIEQRAHAVFNGYFVGTINRVGVEEEFGPGEYYGSSYFCDPRGQIIAQASDKEDEVLVADLDLDLIKEVRDTWQFYRDRRPDTYGAIVQQLP